MALQRNHFTKILSVVLILSFVGIIAMTVAEMGMFFPTEASEKGRRKYGS